MAAIRYVNLGRSGLKVSQLAWGLGLRGQRDESEAAAVIRRAIDIGINVFDCANIYSPMTDRRNAGRSEEILGKAVKGHRDDLVITSKVASAVGPGPNDAGLSRYHIMREVERSLKRLDTDRIDLYLVHSFDDSTPLDEMVRALDDLVRTGKVRYLGCCNFAAWQVCKALWLADRLNAVPFVCVQNPYSLLNRGLEREMFGLARDQGLAMMAYSPLGMGLLSGAYRPDEPLPPGSLWGTKYKAKYDEVMRSQVGTLIRELHVVASMIGKSPAQVSLNWILSHAEVTMAITGGDTVGHLEDNVGALGWELDQDALARLDAASDSLSVKLE